MFLEPHTGSSWRDQREESIVQFLLGRRYLNAYLPVTDHQQVASITEMAFAIGEQVDVLHFSSVPPLTKTTPRCVGERAPAREPVGEHLPEEKPTKCSFVGMIDLEADCLTQSEVSKVECPLCGAMRTVRVKVGQSCFLCIHRV